MRSQWLNLIVRSFMSIECRYHRINPIDSIFSCNGKEIIDETLKFSYFEKETLSVKFESFLLMGDIKFEIIASIH
jgi:hypothetical protein